MFQDKEATTSVGEKSHEALCKECEGKAHSYGTPSNASSLENGEGNDNY
jgi:hypothetical protein